MNQLWVWLKRLWERPRVIADHQQWERWRQDIERIYEETVYVFKHRLIFREIMRMFQNNPQSAAQGGFVWDWLNGVYGRDMVLAVGREVDKHTEVVNLIQLMYQLAEMRSSR